jgi:hypothetical protein
MKDLPDSNAALVVRTDFSDENAWALICSEIEAAVGEFRAYVSYVCDPDFAGLSISTLTSLAQSGPYRSFIFVVDQLAVTNPEHPIVVVDLVDEPGRTFRVIPRETCSVENNLSISNMDFAEFADSADPDGVFRGFAET